MWVEFFFASTHICDHCAYCPTDYIFQLMTWLWDLSLSVLPGLWPCLWCGWFQDLRLHRPYVDRNFGGFPVCFNGRVIPLWSSFPKLFEKVTSAALSLREYQRTRTPGLKGMCILNWIAHYQMALRNSTLIYPPTHGVGQMLLAGLPSIHLISFSLGVFHSRSWERQIITFQAPPAAKVARWHISA